MTGLALALRRSITSPLREVSEAAQHLSSGDLTVRVGYRGRDEIGDVATAFRNLHVTVERLAEEIREMTAAVRHNRLEHRADIAAFEGTWSQLLTGLNDTMAAFAELEGRRERAERELSDFFQLSVDLLCIGNFDGYFTRVNPAFERTLGYTSAELTSRPFAEFVHPDDRELTAEAFASQTSGTELIGFENRYICSDGSCDGSSGPLARCRGRVRLRGARDITEQRRGQEEQAALRRVATLVAQGASPTKTFSAVAAEVGQLFGGDVAAVLRFAPDREATLVGGWSIPGIEISDRVALQGRGTGVACRYMDTRRPARIERFEGPPGSIAAFFAAAVPMRSRRADHCGGRDSGASWPSCRPIPNGCRPEASSPQHNSRIWWRPRSQTRRLVRRCGESPTNRRRCDGWRRKSRLRPRRTPYSPASQRKSAASCPSTAHTWRDTTPTMP